MNDRIKKLAEQAGLEMCSCGCDMPTRQTAKFAELIVQKCVTIVALHGISNFENEDISWVCDKIVKEINEQFGVES